MVFYEYFLQSSVGESRWKVACLNANEKGSPLSVIQAEAFAMIVLKNNYFAWLWDAKTDDCLKNKLFTDYDSEKELEGKLHVGKGILGAELNLKKEEGNQDDANEQEEDLNDDTYLNVLVYEGDPLYRGLEKKTDSAMKKVRRAARNTEKYKEFQKLLHEEREEEERQQLAEESPGANGDGEKSEEEKRIKKRKVLKAFREYTNPQGDEGRFKGWSHRATNDMAVLLESIEGESDGRAAKRFRAAYRVTYDAKIQAEKKKKIIPQTSSQSNYEKNIWRLPEIEEVSEI
jgi:hypothetical protein